MAAKLGFGGCGKACKADGFVDPPPICLSNPRRRSHCVPWKHFSAKPCQQTASVCASVFAFVFLKSKNLRRACFFYGFPLVKVYMGKPGELFAKNPMVGEAGYKVVELSMPWPLSIACQVESRPVGVTIAETQRQKQRIGAFL